MKTDLEYLKEAIDAKNDPWAYGEIKEQVINIIQDVIDNAVKLKNKDIQEKLICKCPNCKKPFDAIECKNCGFDSCAVDIHDPSN